MGSKRTVLDIPIFHQVYDLYKMLHSLQGTVPRMQRYSLWMRCENTTLALLETLISTDHQRGEKRMTVLHTMSQQLDLLKVLIRLAKETRTINLKHHATIQQKMQDIGKMLGG